MSDVLVPISIGELVDKVTILNIKQREISDPAKLANIRAELAALSQVCADAGIDLASADAAELERINGELWRVEDDIRDKERAKAFDAGFIALARAVYVINDQRAAVKALINAKAGSRLREEKSYRDYK
jgi:hypothetical protein